MLGPPSCMYDQIETGYNAELYAVSVTMKQDTSALSLAILSIFGMLCLCSCYS